MNKIDDTNRKVQPAPLRVSRVFSAPRETVFKAWSSADHIKRWFCPSGYSVPEATVEMRAGGRFEVCMRSPEGVDHWAKGKFTEVVAPDRLTIDHHVIDPCGGGPLFSALTQVKFSAAAGGTLMEVVQTYTLSDPAQAEPMLKGRPKAGARHSTSSRRKLRAFREATGVVPLSTAPSISSAPTTRQRSRCTARYRMRRPRTAGFTGQRGGGRSSASWIFGSAAVSAPRDASKAA